MLTQIRVFIPGALPVTSLIIISLYLSIQWLFLWFQVCISSQRAFWDNNTYFHNKNCMQQELFTSKETQGTLPFSSIWYTGRPSMDLFYDTHYVTKHNHVLQKTLIQYLIKITTRKHQITSKWQVMSLSFVGRENMFVLRLLFDCSPRQSKWHTLHILDHTLSHFPSKWTKDTKSKLYKYHVKYLMNHGKQIEVWDKESCRYKT